MAQGPGKYDDICTTVREQTQAAAAIVIVINGHKGTGFSLQATGHELARLPDILEALANQIREDGREA